MSQISNLMFSPCNVIPNIITVHFTTTSAKMLKMLTTLTILICVLAADFGAQQTPHPCPFLAKALTYNLTAEFLPCFL